MIVEVLSLGQECVAFRVPSSFWFSSNCASTIDDVFGVYLMDSCGLCIITGGDVWGGKFLTRQFVVSRRELMFFLS